MRDKENEVECGEREEHLWGSTPSKHQNFQTINYIFAQEQIQSKNLAPKAQILSFDTI